jgi:threonine dehydrogenase-like Zn-dependent dehydrogenase
MKAYILTGEAQGVVDNIPLPSINEEEVLIKVIACGVCATEAYVWRKGIDAPRMLGHEPVGIIVDKGKGVKGFDIGDRVTGLITNAFAEYAKVHYRDIVKVPDELDDLEALGEPLSCLISAAERTPIKLGQDVAIIGAGFMGLGFLQLARIKGAGKVIAIDIREESLSNAKRFGANFTFSPSEIPDDYKIVRWEHMFSRGIPVVVEASGTQSGLDLAGEMTAVHGTLSILGYHQGGLRNVNMELWNWKAITVINAHERRNKVHIECMKAGLELIRQKRLNMKGLITHIFSLEEVDKAFKALIEKPSGFIKAVIKVS